MLMLLSYSYVSPVIPGGWAYGSWQTYQGNLDYTGRQALRGNLSVGRFVVRSDTFVVGYVHNTAVQPTILPFAQNTFIITLHHIFRYVENNRLDTTHNFGPDNFAHIFIVSKWQGSYLEVFGYKKLGENLEEGALTGYDIDTVLGRLSNSHLLGSGVCSESYPIPAIDDVNGDSLVELVHAINKSFGSYYRRGIAALRRPGFMLWFSVEDTSTFCEPIQALTSSDIDGDGIKEILFLETCPEGFRRVVALSGLDGSIEWKGENRIYNPLPKYGYPLVMTDDINNDGYKEAIVILDKVYVYDHGGNLLWDRDLGFAMTWNGAVGDIDRDGVVEILAYSGYNIYALDGRNGNIKWSKFLGYDSPVSGSGINIADIDPTPGYEVLVPLRMEGLKVLDANGNLLWDYRGGQLYGFSVGDADGDGCSEIVGVEDETGDYRFRVFVIDALSNTGNCGSSLEVLEDREDKAPLEGKIYDISGRLIKVGDLKGLKRGIYFIKGKGGIRKVEVR